MSVGLILLLPKVAPWFFRRYGDRVIEPEIKLVFACLLGLMVVADAAKGHAVLPAFVLGLVMARHYQLHRKEQERLRVVAFAFLTPFFFLRGGMNVSLGAVVANLGVLGVLVGAKMVPKIGLVLPLARRHVPEHATFTTLLMSTGLTFGTISSLYGLNAGIIDRTQFSLLVTVVVLSAIVPTAIAQRRFSPDVEGRARRGSRPQRAPASDGGPRYGARMSPYEFTNVLVAVDGSDGGDEGARLRAVDLLGARRATDRAGGRGQAARLRRFARRGRRGQAREGRVLPRACSAAAAEQAAARGVEASTDLVPGHAAEVITHYARAHGHDLIVLGHRGHFLGDYLLGSTADRVAHHAHCPVMVVR